ncbi:MAG: hypothetical protein P4L53_09845, partial [Candidatus Obscuribacterales bacterium]|nr:hypothetical protein [Candidatus Obscuribacterales bacterium]
AGVTNQYKRLVCLLDILTGALMAIQLSGFGDSKTIATDNWRRRFKRRRQEYQFHLRASTPNQIKNGFSSMF